MPLRDHFHPPVNDEMPWDGFHGQWPAMIVLALNRKLPRRYVAAPQVHHGAAVEIDVVEFDKEPASAAAEVSDDNGGVATAVWAPPRATLAVETDWLSLDEYEVHVFDTLRSGRRLVAAVEIVSPANKDRPEHRRAFVAKCAALLQKQVAVSIVDLVTTRQDNLYADLLDLLGKSDPSLGRERPALYAATCRNTLKGDSWLLETWMNPLALGQPLPTLPLWLADNLAMPLDLEPSYEETCRVLRLI